MLHRVAPWPRIAGILTALASLAAALVAWLSQGTLVYARPDATERLALLPTSVPGFILAMAVGAAVWWALRRGARAVPLSLLALIAIPWIPIALPSAVLLWSGRLSLLVWIAVAACMAAPFLHRLRPVARPQLIAGVAAFALGALSFWQVSKQLPAGDEPHYLVITQSLLKDGDLRIENNHRERHFDRYFAGPLAPDYLVRGRNGEIYSIHAPGVSALVAPAFAVGGYPAAIVFVLVIAALGSALTWHLTWMFTGRHDAAWFAWSAITFSATWIFHSFTVYPDNVGAVLALTGAWALLRAERERPDRSVSIAPWLWHGAALAALPWLHTRFSVMAGGIGALVLLRLAGVPNAAAKAFAFLAVPAVSLIAWLAYFIAIYGTANPAAPYGGQVGGFEFVPDGLAGLLFDQGFGVLAYAPALLFAFIGLGAMLARTAWRRHALECLFVIVPYLVVVAHFPMWWGGRSAPARFFVPVLLWLAIPAAAAWSAMSRRTTRALACGAVLFTAFASAVLVSALDGALAFNEREAPALWLEWLNGNVDLAHALPMWFRVRETPLFRGIAVWGALATTAWALLRGVEQKQWLRSLPVFCTAVAFVFACAASVAAAVSWGAQHLSGRVTTPAQLDALRRLSNDPRVVGMRLTPPQRLPRTDLAHLLRIEPATASTPGGAGRNDRPLYSVPAIPAGEYRIQPRLRGTAGWMMVGIGRDQFAIRTLPLTEAQAAVVVHFPVDVRALVIRVDEEARANFLGLSIQPLRVTLAEDRLTSTFARHAVRYGQATAYFLDENSFPEPESFWVGGSRSSEVVLQPDTTRATETLLLRNGRAENTVMVSTGSWREEVRLGAGEERQIQVPLDHARGATVLRFVSASGFRPSELDPGSRDTRFLGVWVRVGG